MRVWLRVCWLPGLGWVGAARALNPTRSSASKRRPPAPARLLPCRPHALPPPPTQSQGYLATSFNDTYYQLAASPGRNPGVPPLTQAQLAALEAFREVASSVKLDFWLQPGDLQVVHNKTQVHNRSAYEDYDVRALCVCVCAEDMMCTHVLVWMCAAAEFCPAKNLHVCIHTHSHTT